MAIKLKYKSKRSVKEVIATFDTRKTLRFVWDNHWREIADYMLPRKNDILRTSIPGAKKGMDLFDNTAMHSLELLASALHGLLTNPATFFFDLTSGDPDIDFDDECRLWMQHAMRLMHAVLNESNFQTEVHEFYLDLVGFGTAPMSMEEDPKYVVRFRSWHVKNCYLEENSQGVIDDISRFFEWNAQKIVARFGPENCSKIVQKAFNDKDVSTKFGLIHSVYPSDPEADDPHAFISHYMEHDTAKELDVKGFNEFPYLTARWSKISEEIYGRSPGMTALPEAKTINEMTKQTLIAAQKMVDPPLMVPDDGFILPIKTKPGGLNYKRAGTQDKVEPLFSTAINLDISDKQREAARQRIKEAFYVDQLSLGQNNPQMTATEVNARGEQAMTLLGPMLGRLQSEFLQPKIMRLFNIMLKRKMFKTIPLKLQAHGRLSVQYSSLIAKAQRQVELRATQKYIEYITPFANVQPNVIDNLDGDMAARIGLKITGAPQEILRTEKDRDDIRKARDKAQQEAQKKANEAHQAEVASKTLPAMAQMQQAQKQGGNVGG